MGWSQVLVSKWQPPGWLMPVSTPQYLYHQCPCPCSEPQLPPTSLGDSPSPPGRSGPGFYEVTVFSPGSRCTWDLVCALQEWSFCFPQSCGVPVIKAHWPSKPNVLEAPPPMPDLQAWEPDVGLRTLTLVREPLQCNYFSVPPTISLWLLFVFGSRISFLVGYSLFCQWLFSR